MMNRNAKYLSGFCIWVAWMVITAHSIIPHDHHLADSFTGRDEKCPVSESKAGHTSGFPIHCHSLNDFASESASKYSIIHNIQLNDITFDSFPSDLIPELQLPLVLVTEIREPFPDSYFLEIPSLRAPPSLV
jgi:hypothetical protein